MGTKGGGRNHVLIPSFCQRKVKLLALGVEAYGSNPKERLNTATRYDQLAIVPVAADTDP